MDLELADTKRTFTSDRKQFTQLPLKENGRLPSDYHEDLDINDVVGAYRRAKDRIGKLNINTLLEPATAAPTVASDHTSFQVM